MKKILLFVIMLSASLGLIACAQDGEDGATEEKNENIRVGYITMDLGNPYFVKLIDGMEEKAEELNIDLSIHDGENEVEPQIRAMEDLITQQVDAIVLSTNDSEALNPMVKKAKDAGIKVIAANAPVEEPDAFIGSIEYDNGFQAGEIAGNYIAEQLNGEAKVAILQLSTIPAALERTEGQKEGLLSLAPNAEIIAETDASTREGGLTAIETLLQSHPDLNVVLGINDDAVLGAYQAMKAAGKEGEDVALVGFDAIEEALLKVKEGGIYRGTIDIAPFESGKVIIETAQRVLEEGPIEELIEFPVTKVTEENVNDFLEE
ncbi:MAG: sugar ABC transporter substrate-binding protein [Alkalibacterium gilvum]|uniref:Ribose transport system substrate-binding protein n=1 Tax=Alkalibacterium gilvum TaxID=1130080 RepID=A0A1H6RRJ7_9LACT|nr:MULTISPECIES: sugar ABC transporter substrate-binding protein [Alkalibacterium]MDN6194345.1 sugar ABC transporter substrate-binding protein [Alkalibacterium sp.]MDN6294418.1 sugar ABC transporter substrate-binding protein [Alkalibacterium sp.]MDN6296072.1 sugar ABC transporter substrate-binding protein [Alkalibacterium sp.]MDN6398645.1 sugar ABC transporter substrate-binding protein [Alkalibacterium sp.]MDN6729853.1 sugar ABC transporter substrate-binding protein [Alkalibacterium sp.]